MVPVQPRDGPAGTAAADDGSSTLLSRERTETQAPQLSEHATRRRERPFPVHVRAARSSHRHTSRAPGSSGPEEATTLSLDPRVRVRTYQPIPSTGHAKDSGLPFPDVLLPRRSEAGTCVDAVLTNARTARRQRRSRHRITDRETARNRSCVRTLPPEAPGARHRHEKKESLMEVDA